MRKAFHAGLTVLAVLVLSGASVPGVLASGGSRALGTVTGTVVDNKGKPVAGAVVSLLREGAKEVVKQTRTATDGSFSAKINPGRYSVQAIAEGFNAALFSAVEIRPSDQLIYRFNLEPIGSGRTAPERRRDRDDAKWRLRATQGRRSVFQIQQGDEDGVRAALGMDEVCEADVALDTTADESAAKESGRMQGVIETYAATSTGSFAPAYTGMNFAFAKSLNDRVDLIFAGQTGLGQAAPQRLEVSARVRAGDRHRIGLNVGGVRINTLGSSLHDAKRRLGQFSVRAVDEWIVRDGVVIVLGLDYSQFFAGGRDRSLSPRLGVQFDANARTRIRAAYAPGGEEMQTQSMAAFEGRQIAFKQPGAQPIALVDGRAVMERSRRFELGVERILDNESSVEATAFFDTTQNRGVGLMNTPLSAFAGESGESLIKVANQQGAARGLRVVYSRRISQVFGASAGYSFGRGQSLSPRGLTAPAELFDNGFFQTAALQLNADFQTGTHVRTVFRFSPGATVFAIDPFAGRLAVFDPSLSILVTQDLPTFGLPVRAEAVIDARNLLDTQATTEDDDTLLTIITGRRSVRGGISVRF
jgi:Carboxypeptidase regulatory-like domain/TonB dependent receptor